MPTQGDEPPKEVACGAIWTWSFRKSGDTRWKKSRSDAINDAEDLAKSYSKATQDAANKWASAVKCKPPCPGGAKCEKGKIRVDPPEVNGDPNTWVADHPEKPGYYSVFVEVTSRAVVPCYCGETLPKKEHRSTDLSTPVKGQNRRKG